MTNTQIGSTVTALTGPEIDYRDEIGYNLAVDLLKGCHDDYVFLCVGTGQIDSVTFYRQYVLLVGDIVSYVSTGQFDFENVQVYQIYGIQRRIFPVENSSFDGTSIDSSGGVGSFSGRISSAPVDYRYSSALYTYHRDSVTVNFSAGDVVYSSWEHFPHIVEGVENYAFAAFAFAVVVVVFKLADRIFRRVY